MSNSVFIATSIDGFDTAPNGNLDWLDHVPFPEGEDGGCNPFISRIDAIVMGRVTFESVIGFGQAWHYPVPGIVLSSTMRSTPVEFANHVQIASEMNGCPEGRKQDADRYDRVDRSPSFVFEHRVPLSPPRHRLLAIRARSSRRHARTALG